MGAGLASIANTAGAPGINTTDSAEMAIIAFPVMGGKIAENTVTLSTEGRSEITVTVIPADQWEAVRDTDKPAGDYVCLPAGVLLVHDGQGEGEPAAEADAQPPVRLRPFLG